MGREVADLYIDERNYLLRKRLDRLKKTQQHQQILLHLVKKKKESDFQVITSGDISRITSKFPNQNVLFCEDTEEAKVTREGKSLNILMCLSQKTQGRLLVFCSHCFFVWNLHGTILIWIKRGIMITLLYSYSHYAMKNPTTNQMLEKHRERSL
jgi:hypothetical protein